MPILRLVIAWLLMATLPLQGFAAASMLFCGQAAQSATARAAGHEAAAHAPGAHDSMGAGPSRHVHDDGGATSDETQDAKGGHACPICASCCNLVALPGTPVLTFAEAAPAAHPQDAPVRVTSRHAPAPDKPPRA